jgi:hypothetical protein
MTLTPTLSQREREAEMEAPTARKRVGSSRYRLVGLAAPDPPSIFEKKFDPRNLRLGRDWCGPWTGR